MNYTRGSSRTIALIILGILTVAMGVLAVVIALRIQQSQAPGGVNAAIQCGGGMCSNDVGFGPDCNAPQTRCEDRAAEFCSGLGAGVTVREMYSLPQGYCNSPTSSSSTQGDVCGYRTEGNSIVVVNCPANRYTLRTFTRARESASDACFVNESNADNSGSQSVGNGTYTPTAGNCFCQQIDLYDGNNFLVGTKASGAMTNCGGSSSTTTTTTTTTTSTAAPSITKVGALQACTVGQAIPIAYTITVRNNSNAARNLTRVVDTLPSGINTATQVSGVSPSGAALSGRTITWNGTFSIPANGSLQFRYTLTVTAAQVDALNNQITNSVEATFGSGDTISTEVTTPLNCLPTTGLFDEDGRPILIGLILILFGIMVNRLIAIAQGNYFELNWLNGNKGQHLSKSNRQE